MMPEQNTVLPPELRDGEEQHVVVLPARELVASEPETPTVDTALATGARVGRKDGFFAGIVAVLVTSVIAGGAFLSGMYSSTPETALSASPVVELDSIVQVPEVRNPYYGIVLEARAAVVYDVLDDAFLFSQNESSIRSLASLTKVMTSLVGAEEAESLERIAIPAYAIETEGDSGLYANETWNLRDLIKFTLVTSSNDGADAVAASIGMKHSISSSTNPAKGVEQFVSRMNEKATSLGLASLSFTNPTGLDESSGKFGGQGNAADMARLVAYTWTEHPEILQDSTKLLTNYTSLDGFIHDAQNTNKRVLEFPGLLASKTGYTDYAGGNLAILYDAGLNHPVVIVVLGSSVDGRFTDVQKLVDATATYLTSGWYAYESSR